MKPCAPSFGNINYRCVCASAVFFFPSRFKCDTARSHRMRGFIFYKCGGNFALHLILVLKANIQRMNEGTVQKRHKKNSNIDSSNNRSAYKCNSDNKATLMRECSFRCCMRACVHCAKKVCNSATYVCVRPFKFLFDILFYSFQINPFDFSLSMHYVIFN